MNLETMVVGGCLLLGVVLLLLGAPFFVAFLACAFPILLILTGMSGQSIGNMALGAVKSSALIAIPIFILMGNIMAACGATRILFNLARVFIGWIPGGLGMAAVVASALFGTMCGSTTATAMAVGTIAVPELKRSGYSAELGAAICSCAGGLGPLIPPSVAFIVIGEVLTCNVGDLFIAGIVPGIICMFFLCIAVYFAVRKKPEIQVERHYTWRERGRAVVEVLPITVIPLAIIGSLWGGICTPSEAGGVGCFVSLLLARFYLRRFGWSEAKTVIKQTIRTSAAIYCILIAALVFGRVLGVLMIPQTLGAAAGTWDLGFVGFMLAFFGVFLVLGCFFDALILTLICLPPLLPALFSYPEMAGGGIISFGVLFLLITNIGGITPPVGVVLYAAASGAGADATGTIREAVPFFIALLATALLLIFVPGAAVY